MADPSSLYVGYSNDLKARFAAHNAGGGSPHTAKLRPWSLEFYAAFQSEDLTKSFEAYLQSHTGLLFARKHRHARSNDGPLTFSLK